MGSRQWLGQNLIMDAWSTDITGTQINAFFGIPGLVHGWSRLSRVLVQYQFWTQTVSVAEQNDSIPLPIGVGIYWLPEPHGDLDATAWLPATGDTLFASMPPWRKVSSAFSGVSGNSWECDSGPAPQSCKGKRDITGAEGEGFGMVIDWSGHLDYQAPFYEPAVGFTGHLTVRTLWERF